MKRSQLKKKAIKSKLKNDKTEYEKQCNIIVKLNNCCKKIFSTILKQKIILKHFGRPGIHISLISIHRVMQIYSLLKTIKFY